MKWPALGSVYNTVDAAYDRYNLGFGYHDQDALLFSAGVTVGQFTVFYSYDLTVSKLTNYTGGSHEIHLGFMFLQDKWSDSRTNTRMFF